MSNIMLKHFLCFKRDKPTRFDDFNDYSKNTILQSSFTTQTSMCLVLCAQELATFTRRGNLIITEAVQPQSFHTFAFAHLTDAFIQSYLQSRQDTTELFQVRGLGQEPSGARCWD